MRAASLRVANEAMLAMDRWLAAVESDTSEKPLADKIVDDRPADIEDRCSNLPGLELLDLPGVGKVCEQEALQTRFGSPKAVAGGPVEKDVNACALEPLRLSDADSLVRYVARRPAGTLAPS